MNTINKPIKDQIKSRLYKEIADASQQTDCPFTIEQIGYFFENVFANLDDDDGFYRHYDAAMQMSYDDLTACFYEHDYLPRDLTNDVFGVISCINHDTRLFHLEDLDHCKKLSLNFSERKALQAMLLSNMEAEHKVELFNELGEMYDIQNHGDYDTIKEKIITFEYRYRELSTPETFLANYDGVIAKALLKRDYEQRYQPKDTKTKTRKI